ncbi:MAG TPA: fibronectin type III domain-containing protein, partial [Thermoanaerobaculia bacterium]|nr:fibronectin type III domain-containing protein [Thermoanaerobaculia bacterium]
MKTKLAITAALLAALLSAPSANAQANAANYSFSTTTTGSLTNMSSGTTQLLGANIDDTASPVTLLGFDFFFMGVRQDRFSINDNGVLRFAAGAQAGSPYKPLAQAALPIVTAYGADQRTHAGDGKVHFRVTGAAPNRVATIEWLNNQADFNAGGAANLTYEVRLFETTGCIEYAYGAMTMSAAGSADVNSQNPNIGFSSSNAAGTVGSVTAAQSGTPAPTFNGASATPVANLYTAGTIPVLTSAADGSRRTFLFCSAAPAPAGGPVTFTGITPTGMTLNWTDSANEVGYAVYSSTDGGASYTFAGAAAQNATSFVATGLAPSTTYDWRVVAVSEGAQAAPAIGTQGTPAPTVKTSAATGGWNTPATWTPVGVPGSGDAVTIAAGHTVTIDTAAAAFSVTVANTGILQYEQTVARTLTLSTSANVQAGGTFRSNPAGTVTTHNLSLPGSLTNDGTLDFSTNADTAGAIITFTGTANATFSGTGATTDIRQITTNKGTTPVPILEIMPSNFTVRGVTTDTVVGGWLVMTNGTIKISGTFAGTSRVFAAAAYTIPVSFGVWLNNPNYVVAAQAGNAVNNGVFRLTQGTFNQGTLASHSFRSGVGAVFTIEGGTMSCAGQFSPQNAVTYNQSGGTLNVGTVGNSQSNFATFELFSASAVFNMTGGTINIVQASTGATQIDYQNLAIATAAGGTVRVGTAATVTKFTFNLRGNLPNLIIDNTTNNKSASATAQVNLLGTTLINTGTTLTINGQLCLVLGPTFTNNGTLTGTAALTRFYLLGGSGPTTYTGTGVVTAPLTSFEVDNVAGVTINPTVSQIVTARFNNFSGGLTGSGKLTIGNGGATTAVVQLGVAGVTQPVNGFDVPPVFNPGTGGVILLYAPELTGRTTGPEMPPSRTLTTLAITNTNDITIAGGDVTVNGAGAGALALGAPRLITGPNTLYFNSAAGTVTRTTGYVDGNFRKSFAAAGSKTFEVGTANGYTPFIFNATAGTFPADVTVASVQTPAPGIQPLSAVISRFWKLTATGITADLTFSYLDPADIPGTVTEANLHALRHEAGNPADYSDQGGTINTAANTATVTGVSSFSDWTLGEAVADLAITKTDGVAAATPGGAVTYTITASNNGTVGNAAAVVADTFPAGLTCSTTCVGALGGTCAAGPTVGNINDTISLPSGGSATYTAVCAIDPSATGSISNTATISGGAVTDSNAANNSATDTDTLGASADLSITKTDGVTTATAGGSVTYTITASNAGPSTATGTTVADTFPASLTCTWTCVGAGGGTCTAAGSGNINGSVNLPAGGSVTYTASCTISAGATGTLANTATVTAPGGVTDPTPGNNSATDSDTLGASADLSITKTDGVTTATAGGSVTYTIVASNAGPSNATGSAVADTFPASLTCTWTCAGAGGGTCTAAGSGNIN